MGGDYAPRNTVLGAVQAIEEDDSFDLLLAGRKEEINRVLKENNLSFNSDNIIDAPEIIEMSETPTSAIKTKKQSSIVIGAEKVKSGEAHAFVSAGNTGAMMAASTLIMGRIPGVGRPTIGASIPD